MCKWRPAWSPSGSVGLRNPETRVVFLEYAPPSGGARFGVSFAMSKKLFVGGLSWGTTDDGLHQAFERFGEIVEAKVITDRETGRSRGFGFVSFTNDESAVNAATEMNGAMLDGRTIRVNEAENQCRAARRRWRRRTRRLSRRWRRRTRRTRRLRRISSSCGLIGISAARPVWRGHGEFRDLCVRTSNGVGSPARTFPKVPLPKSGWRLVFYLVRAEWRSLRSAGGTG